MFHLINQLTVNLEPAICNGHLPYPWGWVRGGESEELDAGGGVSRAKHLGEGRQ